MAAEGKTSRQALEHLLARHTEELCATRDQAVAEVLAEHDKVDGAFHNHDIVHEAAERVRTHIQDLMVSILAEHGEPK